MSLTECVTILLPITSLNADQFSKYFVTKLCSRFVVCNSVIMIDFMRLKLVGTLPCEAVGPLSLIVASEKDFYVTMLILNLVYI